MAPSAATTTSHTATSPVPPPRAAPWTRADDRLRELVERAEERASSAESRRFSSIVKPATRFIHSMSAPGAKRLALAGELDDADGRVRRQLCAPRAAGGSRARRRRRFGRPDGSGRGARPADRTGDSTRSADSSLIASPGPSREDRAERVSCFPILTDVAGRACPSTSPPADAAALAAAPPRRSAFARASEARSRSRGPGGA